MRILLLFLCALIIISFLGCISFNYREGEKKGDEPEKEQAALTVENSTQYEIKHVYYLKEGEKQWSADILNGEVISANSKFKTNLPQGEYLLKVEFEVNDSLISYEDHYSFKAGKSYVWQISEDAWPFPFADTYQYLGDTYSYYYMY